MSTLENISKDYIECPFSYARFESQCVQVGNVKIGNNEPIVLQSMAISDTMHTESVVNEAVEMFQAGSSLVRITTPGSKDAKNLSVIKKEILKRGYNIPLVADIHFTPKAAMIALEHVEKVRINPGNFCDSKNFKSMEYTDEQYTQELLRIKDVFLPLVIRAKKLNRVLRIGSNHGSLSDRILNRYGDTPFGMVESAMEYLRIARDADFNDLIVSMKASNPQVMIQAYRLLVRCFKNENMNYPLHLGVTEAGYGRDGRIKSAVGIGALLLDGLGDTIRVSLTEDAVNELPPARKIAALQKKGQIVLGQKNDVHDSLKQTYLETINPYQYNRLHSKEVKAFGMTIGKKNAVNLIVQISQNEIENKYFSLNIKNHIETGVNAFSCRIDLKKIDTLNILTNINIPFFIKVTISEFVIHLEKFNSSENIFPHIQISRKNNMIDVASLEKLSKKEIWLDIHEVNNQTTIQDEQTFISDFLKSIQSSELQPIYSINYNVNSVQFNRLLVASLISLYEEGVPPIFLQATGKAEDDLIYKSSAECGSLFLDGIGDGLVVACSNISIEERIGYGLDLLQATRLRLSKTEFISCPSCGRTIFDLQKTTSMIKEKTGHLKGLKIAVMGCIVNGPGEMADADFGYVGAGPGKIHLYREKQLIKNNIPSKDAVDELIALIKEHGLWQDKKQ